MLQVLSAIIAVLCSVSIFAWILASRFKEQDFSELTARVKLWWGMVLVFGASVLVENHISTFALAILCFFSLKEFFKMKKFRRNEKHLFLWAYLSIPIQFYFIFIDWYGMFIIFIPIYMFLFLPLTRISFGGTKGYLKSVSSTQWGMMLMVFGLSHLAYFPHLSTEHGSRLVLLLVLLTQLNDVIQYLVSKTIGKRRVAPSANRNLTTEGFVIGLLVTVLASAYLGPFLTPMNIYYSIGAGILISIGGFVGSLNISFVKRDLLLESDASGTTTIKDSFLSRIDSLSYTAPLFFHFAQFFFY